MGDFTARLSSTSRSVLGVDISPTAVRKARERYPNLQFEVGDLLDFDLYRRFKPDCIVMAEISWYVLEKLNAFKSFLHSEMGGGGFVHLLMVYAPGQQRYGREYFTDLNGILKYWDCIKFEQWGLISCNDYKGGSRTFCHGIII